MLWPRRSFGRSVRYFVKRVLRLSASPHAIALGVAVGAFVSFTPFLGFHFILSALIAFILRGNLLASAIGTGVGNPLTFPLIWAGTYEVGSFLLRSENVHSGDQLHLQGPDGYSLEAVMHFIESAWPILKPMIIGSLPLGILTGGILYAIIIYAVRGYQKTRQEKVRAHTRKRALQALERDSLASNDRDTRLSVAAGKAAS